MSAILDGVRHPHLALARSPERQLQTLRVEVTADEIILHGQVSSYYLKQLAQESIRPSAGSRRITNRVAVAD